MPAAAKVAGFRMSGSMLGFGEDYSSPQTIEKRGVRDPATRPERIEPLQMGTGPHAALGLTDIMLHAGFIPEVGSAERKPFLDTLANVSDLARSAAITVAFETGQESATLLRRTLDDLKSPNLKVNFDPANMLLYDKRTTRSRCSSCSPPISAASTSRTPTARQ